MNKHEIMVNGKEVCKTIWIGEYNYCTDNSYQQAALVVDQNGHDRALTYIDGEWLDILGFFACTWRGNELTAEIKKRLQIAIGSN